MTNRYESVSVSVNQAQDVGVERKGRGGAAGVAAVLVAASVVGGTYYAMTMEPQPRPTPPVVPMQSMPKPSAPTEIVSPFAPPKVSARDELTQRLDALRTELETLRKQKQDKLVDMKKKAIKEEIHTIQSGLASLDKR